jgi:hypothetical protein
MFVSKRLGWLAFAFSFAFSFSLAMMARPAFADDPREIEGRAAFSKGDYAGALDIFARLYAEGSDPVYLRNIGRCQQKLRHPDEAIEAFRTYLRRGHRIKAAEKREIEGYIAEMDALKATMKAEEKTAQEKKEDKKEDKKADKKSEARSEKAAAVSPSVETPADRGQTETPAAPPPAVARLRDPTVVRTDGTPPSSGATADVTTNGAIPAASPSGSWHPTVAWVGLGLTLVASGLGVYGIVHNRSLVSSFDHSCGIDPNTKAPYSTAPPFSDSSCVSLRNDYQAASRLAVIGFVGAAVLGAASLVIALTAPSAHEGAAVASWSCAPAVTPARGAALGCRLQF